MSSDPLAMARAWAEGDPDPETQAELEAVLERGDADELRERMSTLEFGTAGLRGVVGAGSGRMNRAVVIRATWGLAQWVLRRLPDPTTLPVVVGFDGRLTSRTFAEDVVAVLTAARIPVQLFSDPVPTPLVAYALKRLGGNAGIVVTASHNPPEYNGYKVFAPNGAQIVPPVDGEIADHFANAPPAKDVSRNAGAFARALELEPGQLEGERAVRVDPTIPENYLLDVSSVAPGRTDPLDRSLLIAYTPMHGVGGRFVEDALSRAGFSNVARVEEQFEPDGRFPTVEFPNPGEPGAMDRVIDLARERNAELVLANDPDADRLAVAVPSPSGRWVRLSGNQIGVLLADFVLEHAPKGPTPLVVSSIVSSPMLKDIADHHGARYEPCLTGFKWIYNAALDLERTESVTFAFGFEEALGYGVGHLVHDKDGISAAVLFAELAARCRARGVTVLEHLFALYRRRGLWVSVQHNIDRPGTKGKAEIAAAMDRLAGDPPGAIGQRSIASVTDFQRDVESRPRWLGRAPLVELGLDGGGRVLVRPSGTEPKLKLYVDLRRELDAESGVGVAEKDALEEARALATKLTGWLGL